MCISILLFVYPCRIVCKIIIKIKNKKNNNNNNKPLILVHCVRQALGF